MKALKRFVSILFVLTLMLTLSAFADTSAWAELPVEGAYEVLPCRGTAHSCIPLTWN